MHPRNREISAAVIEACRQGDRHAFRGIYDAYKDQVYSIAFYFFHGDTATASDVTQQVFLKLMTDFEQFRGASAFSTWMYRLVVNTCIDTSRRQRRRLVPMEPTVVETMAVQGSHEVELAARQTADCIRTAVSSLPQKFRLPILLRYFEDLTYEEIAVALNCSAGTVASRLSRGHKILAAKLAPLRGRSGKEPV